MSSRLPRQVQKQADNAERLIAEFVKGQEAGEGKPADAQASAPPAQDEPNANQRTQPGDAPASTTDAPGAPGQQKPATEPRNDYKAQFFTLQGMYAARGNELAAAKSRIA